MMKLKIKNLNKLFSYFRDKIKIKGLVLSISSDDDKLLFSVATHKCKTHSYDGLVQIKSVQFSNNINDENVYDALDQSVEYFKKQLLEINNSIKE